MPDFSTPPRTRLIRAPAAGAAPIQAVSPSGGVARPPVEAPLRRALDGAIDYAIVTIDLQGTITGWNHGAELILGWTAAEAAGQPAELFFTLEDRAAGIADVEMRQSLACGRANDERWHLRRDGTRFWASGIMMPMPDFTGAPVGFLKILRDQTRQHEAAEALRRSAAALRESEARFRAMADNIPQLAWMARPDGGLTWYNQQWFDYTGTTLAEMQGDGWRAVQHPDHVDRVAAHFYERIAAGAPWEDTFPLRGANGSFRWFLSRARPIRDETGRIELWFGTNTDVEDSRAAEAANTHLAAVVASSDDAIVSYAAEDGHVLTWNGGAERLFGWTAAEMVGQPFTALLPNRLPAAERAGVFARAMAEGAVTGYETVRLSKAGESIPVSITATRMLAADGRAIGLSGTFYDLRPRLQAETALRASEAQLRQAQKLEAIGRLAAGVAHDFNNILQGVTGGLELVLDELADGMPAREFAEIALGSARRGSTLTHQLLSYARKQMLQPQAVPLGPFLADLSHLLSRTLGTHIVITARAHPGTPPVHVDPGQLETALLNLAINAAYAMPQGGTLLLDAHPDSADRSLVVIAVTDTGTGMPEDTLARAFEPFFTTKGLDGTGLGLSMVQGFAEQSGGRASIASQPGKGTTVMIRLPVVHHQPAVAAPTAKPAMLCGSGRVLLVDDAADVLATAGAFLDRAGFEVVRAATGEQALAALTPNHRFDLIISDYAMPNINGVALIEQARAVQPGLPALLITGFAEVEGADMLSDKVAVLRKPFGRENFLAATICAMGRNRPAAPASGAPE